MLRDGPPTTFVSVDRSKQQSGSKGIVEKGVWTRLLPVSAASASCSVSTPCSTSPRLLGVVSYWRGTPVQAIVQPSAPPVSPSFMKGLGFRVSGLVYGVQLPTACPPHAAPPLACLGSRVYRGTSLISNTPLLRPYRRTIPRVIWWS